MNGAALVVEQLLQEGVTQVFGYPGGAVIPLYDALYDYPQLKHLRTSHEQHALHAADGYARASGKVGVAIVTSGPGGTNAVTGIATAYMDSVPLVVISGQVPRALMGRDAFQEIDITGVMMPVCKHTMLVKHTNDLGQAIHSAFAIATSGRKGPVLIDIPKDVLTEALTKPLNQLVCTTKTPPSSPDSLPNYYQLSRITDAILKSKKPLIYSGGGVIHGGASPLMVKLAEQMDAPVVNSLMGLGSIDRNHPLSLGLVGMHGSTQANLAMNHADLVIALGVRFSDRVIGKPSEFAPNAIVVHIDLDATELGKNIQEDYGLKMDVVTALQCLLKRFDPQNRPHWHRELELFKRDLPPASKTIEAYMKTLAHFFEKSTVATDVGQHQMWTAQYFPFSRPRQFLTSGGLGTMGFGLGAALGACIYNSGQGALLITGDGSFRMNMVEMMTIKALGLPVTVVMLNNRTLGMVRQWQTLFQEGRYSETDLDDGFDLCAIVGAMGIHTTSVNSTMGLESVLSEWQATGHLNTEPHFIEIEIEKNAGVYPIVPPGQGMGQMIV